MIVVFDIDGTLCDVTHRVHYWRETPKNWDKFKSEMINDTPIRPICKLAREMWAAGHTILLCSGRGEDSRDLTERWMRDNKIIFDKIYMRAEKDFRHDAIVKQELLDQIIDEFGKPDLWFDDRPRVVKMLRSNGIFVADVYQGEEDF